MCASRPVGLPLVVLTALLLKGCGAAPQEPAVRSTPPEGAPRLVLFLVVDQLRADYLERFRPLYQHGLDRLLRESAVFTDTRHDHAWTKTAPGHATLATGVHPSRHGIVSNEWYDRELGKMVESDEDDRWDDDRSPHYLLAPTLADRMKKLWPQSKVYGASGKSRGAILPVGHNADRAFWIDDEIGRFLTSTYYGESEPEWLAEFHRQPFLDRFFGSAWEPLPETVAASTAGFDIEPLDRGLVYAPLPRAIGRSSVHPDEFYYEDIYWTPFIDRFLLELAQTILVEEALGTDDAPDFLSLSFSALDLVGHAYGPDSPEILDTLLRLDRTLGELLDFVDERVGLESTLISLSADHGVSPVPEVSIARGYRARRFGLAERRCVQSTASRLDAELGDADWFLSDFTLDPEALAATGVASAEAQVAVQRLLEACPGVERVWTATELAEARVDDPMHRLHRNNFHPERSPDVLVQFEPWSVTRTDNTTTHGSPYPYDTRVPWLVRTPVGRGKVIEETVFTVDVAPTLAGALGIEWTGDLDGRDRSAALDP